jgi:TonB family protein
VSLLASVLLALGVAQSTPAPNIVGAPAPQAPEWLTLVDGDDLPQGVAGWYEELLRKTLGVSGGKIAGSRLEASLSYRREWSEFTVYVGPHAGIWTFVAPAGSRWPTQAMRFNFGGAERYAVTAHLYCSDDAATCARFRTEAPTMRAPMGRDLREDTSAYQQWLTLVRTEPCAQGPELINPPKYPASAFRNGAYGIVQVRAFVNACGEVRDVRIHKSSRNHELDRAALDATRWWRLSSRVGQEGFDGWAIIPVNFPNPFPGGEKNHTQ